MIIYEKFPHVPNSKELVDIAFRKASKEGRSALAKGGAKNTRVRRAERAKIKTVSQLVCRKLERLLKVRWESLTPFYLELIEVLIGVDKMKETLKSVENTVKKIRALEKMYIARVGKSKDVEGIYSARREFYGRVASTLKKINKDLDFLREAVKIFKDFPSVEDTYTVVIAGAPNVGKSTLLKSMTTAKPKVESYPFTTQRLLLGYFHRDHERYQVVDTPGLLDRSIEERNPIEKQAVLALRYLADVVLFVFDPSETCGYSREAQINIYREVKREFPNVMPVINKADLLTESDIAEFRETLGEKVYICSALNGEGVGEIIETIVETRESRF
jgi:nucleolar GTP-binding protein